MLTSGPSELSIKTRTFGHPGEHRHEMIVPTAGHEISSTLRSTLEPEGTMQAGGVDHEATLCRVSAA